MLPLQNDIDHGPSYGCAYPTPPDGAPAASQAPPTGKKKSPADAGLQSVVPFPLTTTFLSCIPGVIERSSARPSFVPASLRDTHSLGAKPLRDKWQKFMGSRGDTQIHQSRLLANLTLA